MTSNFDRQDQQASAAPTEQPQADGAPANNSLGISTNAGTRDEEPVLQENYEPSPGLQLPGETNQPREPTRRKLAYALVAILAVMVGVGCYGWLTHGDDVERMQNFGLIFAPVVTLLGTILAFYFSSGDK